MTADVRPIMVYGAGGHGRVVAEAAELGGLRVVGFFDDWAAELGGRAGKWGVVGDRQLLREFRAHVIVAVGENATRLRLMDELESQQHSLASVTHPSAIVSTSATIGPGVFIGPRAVVNAEARIGRGAIINSGATVEHHNTVGDAAHIGPGAVLCGGVTVGRLTLIGAGAVIVPGVKVGDGAVVGAGAVVVRDVPTGAKVVGNPGREV